MRYLLLAALGMMSLNAFSASPQLVDYGGGPIPLTSCLSSEDEDLINASLRPSAANHTTASPVDLLLADPVGGGGINSPGKPTNNYVDLSGTSSLLDYMCGTAVYNGHDASDIDLASFYDMDEGVAVLAAAPGTVSYAHDGEYDRWTSPPPGVVANAVWVDNTDGTRAYYYHFRKGSVRVIAGDIVSVGDTLGMIGSSGNSTAPHLHFSLHSGGGSVIEPYSGACQSNPSRWISQKPYILNMPFVLMSQGVTTLPLDWATVLEAPPSKTHVRLPATIYSWITHSSGHSSDQLRWEIYVDGALWTSTGWAMGQEVRHGWWYTIWNLPATYGNWTIKIYLNSSLIAQQDFVGDGQPNLLPTIPEAEFLMNCDGLPQSGEFAGTDADGSVFWYRTSSGPFHGTLIQSGGRARKFTYTSSVGFTGRDSVGVYAIDDQNAAGPTSYYVFVSDPGRCCCVGLTGNVDCDPSDGVDISDLSALIDNLYITFTPLCCPREANTDGQPGTDISDLSALIDFLYITFTPTAGCQ